jgi:hypothetical protein
LEENPPKQIGRKEMMKFLLDDALKDWGEGSDSVSCQRFRKKNVDLQPDLISRMP